MSDDQLPSTYESSLTVKQRTKARLLGVSFIMVGIPGLVLPFLQGFAFILIGILFLSFVSPRVHGWLLRLQGRYPNLKKPMDFADKQAKRWL